MQICKLKSTFLTNYQDILQFYKTLYTLSRRIFYKLFMLYNCLANEVFSLKKIDFHMYFWKFKIDPKWLKCLLNLQTLFAFVKNLICILSAESAFSEILLKFENQPKMDKVCLKLVDNVNFTKQANLYLVFGKCIEAVSYHIRDGY